MARVLAWQAQRPTWISSLTPHKTEHLVYAQSKHLGSKGTRIKNSGPSLAL